MTRKQADAAFDSLRRHARAITVPSSPAAAVALLDRAALTKLQTDAMVHYISVGPDNLALAYSVLKAGTATFVAAAFVAADATSQPEPAACSAAREIFAARMTAVSEKLDGADSRERATRLVDAFAGHVSGGRAGLSRSAGDDTCEASTAATDQRVGDLLEAAGIAYTLGQLLESPPRQVNAAAAPGTTRR